MYGISREVIERVVGMRGGLHCLEHIDPARCALLAVDMQNYYLKPGFQAEIAAAPEIVPAINRAARALRTLGGRVIWILTAADGTGISLRASRVISCLNVTAIFGIFLSPSVGVQAILPSISIIARTHDHVCSDGQCYRNGLGLTASDRP